MLSLQHGRSILSNRRKSLLVVSGIVISSGAILYVRPRLCWRSRDAHHCSKGHDDNIPNVNSTLNSKNVIKGKQRRELKALRVVAVVLVSQMGNIGIRDFLSLVAVVVLRAALGNKLAKVQGFLFRAAFLGTLSDFLWLILQNLFLSFTQSALHSTANYIKGALGLRFRKILTKFIHTHYFENMIYYKISHVDGRITDPHQRITNDVPKFCSELSDLVLEDLSAITDSVIYTWHLCSYASPKYILWILAYVTGAGVMIRNLTPAFGKLISKEQELEGEYRQLHSRLRTHAESIAFYGGETREEFHIQKKFRALATHLYIVLRENWWFGMIQDFFLKYLGATVAVILILEPFFSDGLQHETSTAGQAEMLSNLRYHTSVIISLFHSLGVLSISLRRVNRLSGYADRIHELMVVSKELYSTCGKPSSGRNGSRNYMSEANYIEFSDVKVVTPTGNVLVDGLSLKIEPGSNLLITGPNGSGKSSLFRVLGGLWPLVSGYIVKPGSGSDLNKEIFYVPQRPYMAVGTLRDQLIYPFTSDKEIVPLTSNGMMELLRNVDLEYLFDRYPPEMVVNWGDELSLGEQQRLGMARLFYHKPRFAILDECTSAVTTDMEDRFCSKVRAMGTSCITISHRPTLVAFHDMILSLDGDGGWKVHHKGTNNSFDGTHFMNPVDTELSSNNVNVKHEFSNTNKYFTELLSVSPSHLHWPIPSVPQIQNLPRACLFRSVALFKVLAPKVIDRQGAWLLAFSLLVVLRTWVSDRIASLNGTTVKYVLEQDKASFIRLIGVSVLNSAASSFIAPSLRHLTAMLALRWRIILTQHLLNKYMRKNAFYKIFHMSAKKIDADQRLTHDLEKLTSDLSKLLTGMVKPFVDILWFTWRMKLLTGNNGVAILYAYMVLGLGLLRGVTPDFGYMISQEQMLEGTFRFMHSRLYSHAESIAFFGGGNREKLMIEKSFQELHDHSMLLIKKRWLYCILDDFITKQLPHNVTWGLSLLYSMEHKRSKPLNSSTQAELAHALRFLASVVSQSFLAFGDILELHRKILELSGSINRIFELEEVLDASQSGDTPLMISEENSLISTDWISFTDVTVVTPSQKMLARQLTCKIVQGRNMLITGPNGSGKSSLFRVLRGLWPIVSGHIVKPSQSCEAGGLDCSIFYVPQRQYTCLGTLRDQIIYPLSREEAELKVFMLHGGEGGENKAVLLDIHLRTVLESVRLVYILDRNELGWDASPNWDDILSLGEQQRLGMARMFFHKPKFGILDECTNATSVDIEEHLYTIASEMGITLVTSSQRPALIPFHSLELHLVDGQGNWELRSIIHST